MLVKVITITSFAQNRLAELRFWASPSAAQTTFTLSPFLRFPISFQTFFHGGKEDAELSPLLSETVSFSVSLSSFSVPQFSFPQFHHPVGLTLFGLRAVWMSSVEIGGLNHRRSSPVY